MNKLIAAVALASVISSPAFAQHRVVRHNGSDAYAAYSSSPDGRPDLYRAPVRPHSSNPAYDVYDTEGHYVGSDPDPRVREELQFDHNGRGY